MVVEFVFSNPQENAADGYYEIRGTIVSQSVLKSVLEYHGIDYQDWCDSHRNESRSQEAKKFDDSIVDGGKQFSAVLCTHISKFHQKKGIILYSTEILAILI